MNKHRNRPSSGKQAMSANLRKIARQNQLYGFHMALDGIAATWGALIQNLRCDADLTDEQVQKLILIGDRYWEISDDIRRSIKFSCNLCGTDIDVLNTRFATMTANKVWNKIIPECPICGKKMIINSWGAF